MRKTFLLTIRSVPTVTSKDLTAPLVLSRFRYIDMGYDMRVTSTHIHIQAASYQYV